MDTEAILAPAVASPAEAAARAVLEVRDLVVEFRTAAGTVRAVDGVTWSVNAGESGCGKPGGGAKPAEGGRAAEPDGDAAGPQHPALCHGGDLHDRPVRQIGVKVDHQQVELATWCSAQNSGNFEALVDSFTQFSDDPTNVPSKSVSSDKAEVAVAHATDRGLDRLFDEQVRIIEPAARKAVMRQFEARAMDQAYAVPLLRWQRIVVVNAKVRGWTMSPTQLIYQDLSDVWLA